jgi:mannosyltransferase OCH1-like enzyme
MNIAQIFLSDDGTQEWPPFLKAAIGTIDQHYPEANHAIYTQETLRRFIADMYDDDVLWAYDCLQPYSYKADLGRYCLLNTLGGWYIDITMRIANRVEWDNETDLVAFRDLQRHSLTSWACATAILYSKPDSTVMQTAINLIVDNCRRKFYGITPLCPTGPSLFGRALAMAGSNNSVVYGDHLELTPTHAHKNRAFVLPDGTILGWTKPCEGGDLETIGATGVNNYNVLWRNRAIYA